MEYTAPDWAGSPQQECYFEVIKDGRVLEISDIFKSSTVAIGRADCFIKMEHSSISRYHALIQFKNDGSKYLYDLGSTHGTFLNKQRISPRTYCKIKVGDMIKFGASSRIYFFQGEQEQAPKLQETGISWGFRQDAYVGDEWEGKDLQLGAIDRSTIPNDAFYLKDPRSVLKSWLEGRGEELAIRTSHEDDDQVISKIILPVTTIKGDLIAIGFGRNKKKAERDACLEACAKLDKLEILRGSGPSRKKTALEEFGDDTDTFFDRTTQKSKPVLEKEPEKIENYDSLLDQKIELEDSIQNTNDEIRQRTETFANMEASDDDLDAFMQDVQKKIITQEQKALTNKLQELQKVF
jgi:pSer/pThr/pTyr-binding forkhead associated (FHA) protein